MATCTFTFDDEALDKLERLVGMSSTRTNKSKLLRELVLKEYAARMEACDG